LLEISSYQIVASQTRPHFLIFFIICTRRT